MKNCNKCKKQKEVKEYWFSEKNQEEAAVDVIKDLHLCEDCKSELIKDWS